MFIRSEVTHAPVQRGTGVHNLNHRATAYITVYISPSRKRQNFSYQSHMTGEAASLRASSYSKQHVPHQEDKQAPHKRNRYFPKEKNDG